jgi:ABC-2 type transport system ATP-binding protein
MRGVEGNDLDPTRRGTVIRTRSLTKDFTPSRGRTVHAVRGISLDVEPGDELNSQGTIYGLDRRSARRRSGELLEALDLGELAARKVSDLSGGQRRRLDVAMGLVHAPSLLFLDEPSTGLDPQNRANLWEHILRMRAEHGMTIVLTTHYLDEADSMAERVVVVDHGRVIADDDPE